MKKEKNRMRPGKILHFFKQIKNTLLLINALFRIYRILNSESFSWHKNNCFNIDRNSQARNFNGNYSNPLPPFFLPAVTNENVIKTRVFLIYGINAISLYIRAYLLIQLVPLHT